jgi:tetratricopeptide (TPR) repeat protein
MTRIGLAAGLLILSLGATGPAFAYGSLDVVNLPVAANLGRGDAETLKQAVDAVNFKEWDKAVTLLTYVTAQIDESADTENLLGYSHRMLGHYPEAFRHYDRALSLDPRHKGALEYEGEAYLETNQLNKAEGNLSTLKAACGAQACPEYALLQGAIDRYKAKARIN